MLQVRRPIEITPYRDGPVLVRGPVRLLDVDGREVDYRREPIALCRCGKSRLRPFCDGTHKLIDFRADGAPEESGRRAGLEDLNGLLVQIRPK